METAKEHLLKLERLDELIREKRQQLKDLKLIASSFGSISYGETVKTSPKGDSQENKVIKCVALEQEIEQDMIDYLMLKQKIIKEIQSLDDTKYIKVLSRRYAEHKKIKAIAKEMHYDYGYIRTLHVEALNEFQNKVLDKKI